MRRLSLSRYLIRQRDFGSCLIGNFLLCDEHRKAYTTLFGRRTLREAAEVLMRLEDRKNPLTLYLAKRRKS